MKYFIIIMFGFVFCACAAAQDKKFEFQDVCGDPRVESMAWTPFSGKVTEIIDGDSIIIKLPSGKLKTIDLVAIDSASNDAAARAFLTKTLLNKKVDVSVSSSKASEERVWGLVQRNGKQINRVMIEQGIAVFRDPEPYAFSTYWECVYQKVEEKAKESKLGIWAK